MDVLYHASSNKELSIIEPRAETKRDEKEGPVVFATHDKAFASCFLVRTDDSWTQGLRYSSDEHPTVHIFCITDEERFRKNDKGGAIYYVPGEGFFRDHDKSYFEWVNPSAAIPIKKELYDSGLDAMIEHGVIVYFCDKNISQQIRKVVQDPTLVARLLKDLVSENEKRGLENQMKRYY